MRASSSMQPGRRGAGSASARPALAAFLPAAVLAVLFMAGCSQSSGTQQASEAQQQSEELQQRVDELEKEKEKEEVQQQIDELKKEQEDQANKQEEQQPEPQQEPQVIIENREVVGTAAPEGRVVITPDATYAGTAQEAAALEAAIDYYEAAELGDYTYTYNALVSADQSRYSYQEWLYANEQLDSAAGEFVIFSVEGIYADNVRVGLTVYPASGSPSNRYTDFVYENGAWRHSLTMEEYDLFDSAL